MVAIASAATGRAQKVKASLEAFSAWYGPYPHPRLTVVDVPDDAGGAGGMEYPTLITGGTLGVPAAPVAARLTARLTALQVSTILDTIDVGCSPDTPVRSVSATASAAPSSLSPRRKTPPNTGP